MTERSASSPAAAPAGWNEGFQPLHTGGRRKGCQPWICHMVSGPPAARFLPGGWWALHWRAAALGPAGERQPWPRQSLRDSATGSCRQISTILLSHGEADTARLAPNRSPVRWRGPRPAHPGWASAVFFPTSPLLCWPESWPTSAPAEPLLGLWPEGRGCERRSQLSRPALCFSCCHS